MISAFLTIFGLSLFEVVCSVDNAIINAEVLTTMQEKARKWFLFWGILIAVFLVRGLLPWLIVWISSSHLNFIEAFSATFSNDPAVALALIESKPLLMLGGGVFLIFLFLHWLFLETKNHAHVGEKYIEKHGLWFYSITSIVLTYLVWKSINQNPMMALSAVIGSTAFFMTLGFKNNAEAKEKELMQVGYSDLSKILYLEVIDATFSIDGVLGAFAFTLSVPLILLGNGIGAIVVRQLTVGNLDRIKELIYIKNGAMYSIFFLGMIMVLESFDFHIPSWVSPIITFVCVFIFYIKSINETKRNAQT